MQTLQLCWWRDQLGDRPLAALTPAVVTTWRETLARGDHGTPRAPATVNRYLAALSHVCTVAVREWEWLDSNPLQKVRKLREPRGRVRFLSDAERTRLLEACTASPHPSLYPIVVLALSTGARKMELLTLTWPAVDLRRGRIILHDTKNRERRTVPLVDHALALIEQLAQARRPETPLLFPRPDGRKPLRLEYAWQRARQQAGIADFRFHDLRHSVASYLAMNGASLMEIAVVLGHKTLEMVRRYAHLTDTHVDGVVRGMNAKIFGAAEVFSVRQKGRDDRT
jgi:integrase